MTTEASDTHRLVHLLGSFAPLFGGRSLSDCSPTEPSSCRGGVAATALFRRVFADDGPTLTMHKLDKQSQFVQTHPLGWATNRLVLHDYFGYDFFSSSPSLLLQHKDDFIVSQRDISDLQSHDFPLVLTNAEIPPSVSWHPYVERVHYDKRKSATTTNLAVMTLAGNGEPMSSQNQIAAVTTALKDIAKENRIRGCPATLEVAHNLYDNYLKDYPVPTRDLATQSKRALAYGEAQRDTSTSTTSAPATSNSNSNCWTPVLYFSDFEPDAFQDMVNAMALLEYPPAAIIDGGGNDIHGNYTDPVEIDTPYALHPSSISSSMWVTSMRYSSGRYYQHSMTIDNQSGRIANFTNTILDLEDDLTEEMQKDEQYLQDIAFIRTLADQAEANDPVVGVSTEMPIAREGDYRRCKGGECEQGNLFADSLRWKSKAHVAFVTSGGLRGSGWPAGNVTVSNIWSTLPFPNTMCTGVMTGVSLFKLIDYSMGVATFESGETQDGGRLLQVSGMKIVYNTQLQEHRVISIDIWDEEAQSYEPIERLKYYSFATDSYLCGAYDPYPTLLGEGLIVQGEVPGTIGDDLHQNIVGEFLTALTADGGAPYDASRQGRLTNNTMVLEPLNLIQTQEGCPAQTYWVESMLSCWKCPNSTHVAFSDETLEFGAESGVAEWYPGRILLVNRELEPFQVVPKSIPSWMTFTWATGLKQTNSTTTVGGEAEDLEEHLQMSVDGEPTLLRPGESLALNFAVSAEHLEAGTALGTVSFGVLDGGNFPGCVDNGDATFDVLLRVTPSPELNQLGSMRYVGFSAMTVAMIMALAFGAWTHYHKRARCIQKMQPFFLGMICGGVGFISLAMGSLSFDDEIVSLEWCNRACMSLPWFVSMGWTITFAALWSKLWRINKLFGQTNQFARITVSEQDALKVFSVLFVVNFIILTIWTAMDPMVFVRKSVDGEIWNTYGICSSGKTGDSLMGVTVGLNVFAMFCTAFEAYKARNISGEFSESKQLGLAVYTWLQVIIVGLPVLFLIDSENVTARYFLQVGLIFCLSVTMLLNIFIPLLIHLRKIGKSSAAGRGGSNVKISGIHFPVLPTTTTTSSGNRSSIFGKSSLRQSIPLGIGGAGNESFSMSGIDLSGKTSYTREMHETLVQQLNASLEQPDNKFSTACMPSTSTYGTDPLRQCSSSSSDNELDAADDDAAGEVELGEYQPSSEAPCATSTTEGTVTESCDTIPATTLPLDSSDRHA